MVSIESRAERSSKANNGSSGFLVLIKELAFFKQRWVESRAFFWRREDMYVVSVDIRRSPSELIMWFLTKPTPSPERAAICIIDFVDVFFLCVLLF